jgi:hypothetical protein
MNDEQASFLGGFMMAVLGRIDWIWQLHLTLAQSPIAGNIALEWGIKVLGTFILGIVGGCGGLVVKWIAYKLKNKKAKK